MRPLWVAAEPARTRGQVPLYCLTLTVYKRPEHEQKFGQDAKGGSKG